MRFLIAAAAFSLTTLTAVPMVQAQTADQVRQQQRERDLAQAREKRARELTQARDKRAQELAQAREKRARELAAQRSAAAGGSKAAGGKAPCRNWQIDANDGHLMCK